MQLAITDRSGEGFTEVLVSHKGVDLRWTTRLYNKVRLINPSEVFSGINGYLASLPETAQDGIFEQYTIIKECLDEQQDAGQMVKPIKKAVLDLLHIIPMAHIEQWVSGHYLLYKPSDIEDSLNLDGRYPDRDETYVTEDYLNLAVFSLVTRLMIPIWGEYIASGGNGDGGDLYKELDAMSLLYGSEMMRWPETGDPARPTVFTKLLKYIEINVDKAGVELANLWGGIGTAEIPMRLFAMVLVRRLTIVPLGDHDEAHNIVANVYHYVTTRLKPNERRGRVAPKRTEGEGRDEDDKTSMLEEYKIKQRTEDGDVISFEVDSKRTAVLVKEVDPMIDLRLLDKCMAAMPNYSSVVANVHQVRLAQWALSKAFPPQAFYDISEASVNRLLSAAQALYWSWGMFDVACLMTVERVNLSEQNIPGLTTQVKPSSRFSKPIQDTMMEIYPHFFPQSGKDANDRKGNVGITGVASVLQDIYAASWQYHGPKELHQLAKQPSGTRLLVVTPAIKQSLCEAVFKIVELNQ